MPDKITSRRKTKGTGKITNIVTGNRVRSGVTLERRWARGLDRPQQDEFGLTDPKYKGLGRRCRRNVARAIAEGFVLEVGARTFGTTEEQILYGELRFWGFEVGLGAAPRSFLPQSYIAGHNVDFEVWDRGEKIALRPMNAYWHGHEAQINQDDFKGEEIEAAGYVLRDIWSGDALNDEALVTKFGQFFGYPS
jgi:hypothetical protein